MKTLIFMITISSLLTKASASATPDFKKIFSELEKTSSVTAAMEIREKHLPEMRDLLDLDRLTDLENLGENEGFFPYYRSRMAGFIASNLLSFATFNRHEEKKIFLARIYPKVKDTKSEYKVAEMGLNYISGCEEFKDYAKKTHKSLFRNHARSYCVKGSGLPPTLIHVLDKPLIISEGSWNVVQLPDFGYVKKLYLSVEGLGSDVYFDVMVNGDVKGTIYAPSRDPSYVITVEDYADTILVRSLNGHGRITAIIVEMN